MTAVATRNCRIQRPLWSAQTRTPHGSCQSYNPAKTGQTCF